MSLLGRFAGRLLGSAPTPQQMSMLRFGDYRLTDDTLVFPDEAGRRPLRLSKLESVFIFPDETPPVHVVSKSDDLWIDVGPEHLAFLREILARAPWSTVALKDVETKTLYIWG